MMNGFMQKMAFDAVMQSDEAKSSNHNNDKSGNVVIHSLDGIDDDELAEIKKWAMRIRVMMITISTLMIITAWYNMLTGANSVSENFIAIYVFFFSTLICCYELAMRQIAMMIVQNFGFLYNPIGKVIFLSFVGILLFQLSTMGIVVFCFLVIGGLVQIYVNFKHPKYQTYMRATHYHGALNVSSGGQGYSVAQNQV